MAPAAETFWLAVARALSPLLAQSVIDAVKNRMLRRSAVILSLLGAGCAPAASSPAPTVGAPTSPPSVASASASAPAAAAAPISVERFRDGIQHYKNANNRQEYPRLGVNDTRGIAENILLYQRQNGGFPPNWDPLRVLSQQEKAALAAEVGAEDTSFDNRGTYPQIEYLAEAFVREGDARFRDASLRGLNFMLAAQYDNGGFPHSFPSKQDYRPHITFMDEVMPGVLTLLAKVAAKSGPFGFVPEELRVRSAEAHARGERCLLKLQVVAQGVPTVWAGQYDERTLVPTLGRAYELPSLVSDESVSVVEYLMRIESPSDEVIRAVTSAVNWFERSKINGIRLERFAAEPIRYQFHSSSEDVRVVSDPAAPPLWARFYELDTNRPFMANRDGKKVYSLSEVERERRTGYRWYGEFAKDLLELEYPRWLARIGQTKR